jgi:hypothetical protein
MRHARFRALACVSTASARLFSLWQGTNLQSARSLPDAASAEPAIVPIVPYEKLRRVQEPDEASDNDSPDSVLVLWLKEDILMHKPLTALNSLAGSKPSRQIYSSLLIGYAS